MFRYLIIAAEIVVLVAVLRSSFAQYLLTDIQQTLSQWLTQVSVSLEQTQLDDLRNSLSPYTGQMRDFQRDYIWEVTENTLRLSDFYSKYCVQREINPYVNGNNLEVVCHTINDSKLIDAGQKNS